MQQDFANWVTNAIDSYISNQHTYTFTLFIMTVYNRWTGLDWTTGLLELTVQHYTSILGLTGVIT